MVFDGGGRDGFEGSRVQEEKGRESGNLAVYAELLNTRIAVILLLDFLDP